ncbi:phospholipid carrier-dependent glycosyltransferase [Armatimonas sp.]|uniref:phospholipid carrier-dependent glycosyltransferase n=1 Tax=Armatimonas sp. TaxID=1872638 RepID=UPI00286ABF7C|nr:phospholipid carrier-dependent glycosyltransferase [Armatimonas sp.]
MENLTPAHFILPLTVAVLVFCAILSFYRLKENKVSSENGETRGLAQEPIVRLDYLLAATLSMTFLCVSLWRLDSPTKAVFDECYHSRTGMQYVLGQNPMEWTHPPLAKLVIAVGLRLFGGSFNPVEGIYKPDMVFSHEAALGWRFGSVVFGALSLFLLYFLARQLTGNRLAALLAMGMLALDGVFFVQSRMAMTNIYTVCFILLAALAAWNYRAGGKTRWMLALGLALGLAVATRWTTLYAVGLIALWLLSHDLPRAAKSPKVLALAGLGVTLLVSLFAKASQFYKADPSFPDKQRLILESLGQWALGAVVIYLVAYAVLQALDPKNKLIALPGLYLLAFLVLPICLYLLSYRPYMLQEPNHDLYKVFTEQKVMWDYHSGMKQTHPWSSPWWSWPLVLRPTWYERGIAGPDDGRTVGILCIGNVFVWWASIPALCMAVWRAQKERHAGLGFAALLGLGLWLAWGIQPRPLVFLHYFFEALPFACIVLGYFGARLATSRDEDSRSIALGYGALILFWFGFFYPLLSALPIPPFYVQMHLWLGKLWN